MTGRVADQLAALIELDLLDQELIALRGEEKSAPKVLAALVRQVQERSGVRDTTAGKLEATTKANREGERQLEVIERRVARAAARLDGLFVSTQIEATQREIEQLGLQRDEVEMAVLEGMEVADRLAEELVGAEAAVTEAEASLAVARAAWDERAPVVAARCAELETAQDAVLPKVHKDTLRMYMVGIENRQNSTPRGITRTNGIMCTMCQTDIPVVWVNEARNGEGIHLCLCCKRVIVGKVDVALSDEPTAGPDYQTRRD